MTDPAFALAAALLIDAALGEPKQIWDRIPHPAVLMGRAVAFLDKRLNRGRHRRIAGVLAVTVLVLAATVLGLALEAAPGGGVFGVVLAAVLLAQRSLSDHVLAVAAALREDLASGRAAVSRIVGRDTAALDETGVSRAAIESAAENFSDGVIAPAFWFVVAGPAGILVYKTVNTADSMIGYRDDRYAEFGWAAARLDDVLNWAPARLTGGLIALAGWSRRAVDVMRRDAALHASPNAGWPEAAVAGALQIALSGPRDYGRGLTRDPFVNQEGRRALNRQDIEKTMRLIWRSWSVLLAVTLAFAFS